MVVASDLRNRPLDGLAIECEKRGLDSFCPSIIAPVQFFVNVGFSYPQIGGQIGALLLLLIPLSEFRSGSNPVVRRGRYG